MPHTTKQRRAIMRVLEEAECPLTIAKIYDAASQLAPSLGLATVYRFIRKLVQSGEIRSIDLMGALPHFESARRPPHPSFLCEQCQQLFGLSRVRQDFAHLAPTGFEVLRHEIVLFGRCEACRSLPRPQAAVSNAAAD